jgi:hypothetical protein
VVTACIITGYKGNASLFVKYSGYVLLGLKGGVFVLLGNSVELGLEVGAEGISTEQEITDGFDTEDVTFSGSGVHVAAVLAIPF